MHKIQVNETFVLAEVVSAWLATSLSLEKGGASFQTTISLIKPSAENKISI
jgi:hypothetical protein